MVHVHFFETLTMCVMMFAVYYCHFCAVGCAAKVQLFRVQQHFLETFTMCFLLFAMLQLQCCWSGFTYTS